MSADHAHPEADTRPPFSLPDQIVVLGQRFRVEIQVNPMHGIGPEFPEAGTNVMGACDRELQLIVIRGGGAQTEDKARETLLHETLHAVIGTARIPPFGDHDDEETLVGALAPVLLAVIRDNPALVAALISR